MFVADDDVAEVMISTANFGIMTVFFCWNVSGIVFVFIFVPHYLFLLDILT